MIQRDINARWEAGVPHRDESERLVRHLRALDWELNGGRLDIQVGGDGDNGEDMMYLLDVYFDCIDAGEPPLLKEKL